MWWSHGEWGWGAWLVMTLSMVVFWGLVVWAVTAVARAGTGRATGPDPERVLAERFASGEIDEAEYQRRLDVLRTATRPEDERSGGDR